MALIISLCLAGKLHAHEVSPMRVTLVPAEGRSQSSITINNIRDEALPFEIRTFLRLTQADGSETLEETEDAFLVFPPQGVVQPRTTQAVRLQYVGPPVVDEAVSYVVQVVEIPVERPGFSGVRFTYNFGVAAYVEPSRAIEKIDVISADPVEGGLKLRLRNSGNRYGLLSNYRMIIHRGGAQFEVPQEVLAAAASNPLMPPGLERPFELLLPDLPSEGAIRVELRSQ